LAFQQSENRKPHKGAKLCATHSFLKNSSYTLGVMMLWN